MHTINQQITNRGMRVKFFQARLEIVLSSTQNIFEKFIKDSALFYLYTLQLCLKVFPVCSISILQTANAIKVTKWEIIRIGVFVPQI